MGAPLLLDAYAARSCPVKTQNRFDPTVPDLATLNAGAPPDEALAELFEGGSRFEAEMIEALAAAFTGPVVDLREVRDAEVCRAAMADGVAVIVGGRLPIDAEGHRIGSPDLLVRATDGSGYHPVEIKFHKVLERRKGRPGDPVLTVSGLGRPTPTGAEELPGVGFRLSSRPADLIQLAHYHRLLRACGFASAAPLVGVIGTDTLFADPVIAWIDLERPLLRTFSRRDPDGWMLRSVAARYDHEHAFRVDVAERARQRTGGSDDRPLLVRPIRIDECNRCPWWAQCRPQLHPDDVSLRIDKGALDPREIGALRARGIETITDLVAVDLDTLLTDYLPEVTHRPGAEDRLRLAARRARMLVTGASLDRTTDGPIEVPGAAVEIDVDLETSPDGRAYLWGFLVCDTRAGTEHYVHHDRFAVLDDAAEIALAERALSWLQAEVETAGGNARVYHYSEFERAKLDALVDRHPSPVLRWAQEWFAARAVDLLVVVKAHWFGAHGLGLKVVATDGAGFGWRDDDPGGLNSQAWFGEAVAGETAALRVAARQRVLDYNEDDVIATARVRGWLRAARSPSPVPVAAGGPPGPR